MLHIRDDALAALGDGAPAFTVTRCAGQRRRPTSPCGSTGTFTVPNYLTGDGAPGQPVRLRRRTAAVPTRCRCATATSPPDFICNIPRRRAPTATTPRARRRRCTATACSATTTRSTPATCARCRTSTNVVFCATKWAGIRRGRHRQRGRDARRRSQLPHAWPTALQQGVLNQLFLGRLMTRTGASPRTPRSGVADGTPLVDRTHSTTTATARAASSAARCTAVSHRLDARGARRARHELLALLLPARSRLRRPTRRSSSPPTPTSSTAAAGLRRRADAVGPRRGRRLRPAPHRRPVPGHPAPRRCCCTSRSATTRWPT